MTTIYDKDGLTVDICYNWSYYEVFGLSNDDFVDDRKYCYGLCTHVSGNSMEDTQSGTGGLTMDDYISRDAAIEANVWLLEGATQ